MKHDFNSETGYADVTPLQRSDQEARETRRYSLVLLTIFSGCVAVSELIARHQLRIDGYDVIYAVVYLPKLFF